jgi:hypothetical protein
VLFEHLIYSTAIAIIAGMIWYKHTGRDPSWIIIASAYAPDFDIVAGELTRKLGMNILIISAQCPAYVIYENEPQIKAPRVTLLEGSHICLNRTWITAS